MNKIQKKAFLADHFALENLSTEDIEYLAENAQIRIVEAGETVFFKDDPSTNLVAVVSGGVQIRTISKDGKELLLNTMKAGEMFGEIGVIDGGQRTSDAVAVERTELLTIGRRVFLNVVERNSEFCKSLLVLLCGRIRATSEQTEDLALLDLKTRLAKKLVALTARGESAGTTTGPIVLRLTQREIGIMMGTTREAVNKHLSAWAKDGVISLRRKEIAIHDREALRRIFDT